MWFMYLGRGGVTGGSTGHGEGPPADSICRDKGGSLVEQKVCLCDGLADEAVGKMGEWAQQAPVEREGTEGVRITETEDFNTDGEMPPFVVEVECALIEHMSPDMTVRMGSIIFKLKIPCFLFITCRDM